MITERINNAEVHLGYITFVHAKINDQSLETLVALGRGKQSRETNCLKYDVGERTSLFLWV